MGNFLALLLGNRQGISFDQWQIFLATGTSHLVAISGLHVGLVALWAFWLARVFIVLLHAVFSALQRVPICLVFFFVFRFFIRRIIWICCQHTARSEDVGSIFMCPNFTSPYSSMVADVDCIVCGFTV